MTEALETKLGAEEGDLLLFLAGSEVAALKAGGELRRKLAKDLGLLRRAGNISSWWLVDCPLFQRDKDSGQLEAFSTTRFVRPAQGDIKEGEGPHVHRRGIMSYDLVLDGSEIGSGSVRCHDPEVQRKVLRLLGLSDEKIESDFGFFLEALGYGAPPHGGIALGIDRLVAILLGCETIREVIAFPKNKKFQSLMDGSPAKVEEAKLAELQLLCLAGD